MVECVRQVYGDSYIIHTELYHPEQIVDINRTGHLVSVVALEPEGRIVGHYALEATTRSEALACSPWRARCDSIDTATSTS